MLLAFALYGGDFAKPGDLEGQFCKLFRWLSAGFGVVSLAWPGRVFFRGALAALRARVVILDLPIAITLLVGGAIGLVNVALSHGEIYFDSLCVLVFLLLVGRFLQHRQQRRQQCRAAEAVQLMQCLVPSTCRRVAADGRPVTVPVSALRVGDVVEVRSGDLVPADGVVVQIGDAAGATSHFDLALLTGESEPVTADVGAKAWAGARNLERAAHLRVESVGQTTWVGRLMESVEAAVDFKPPVVQLADRVAGVFVSVMITLASLTFAYWAWTGGVMTGVDRAVALLIVACPCALALATPFTLAVATARCARRDTLVKRAGAMETLSKGGRLLLDKTGTLTLGRVELLVVAALAGEAKLVMAFGDQDRPGAADHLRELRQMGWQLEVLSGDAPEVVRSVVTRLGLDPQQIRGGMTPEQKLERVRQLQETGERIVMVGDGVNDAAADVGVAVAGGRRRPCWRPTSTPVGRAWRRSSTCPMPPIRPCAPSAAILPSPSRTTS